MRADKHLLLGGRIPRSLLNAYRARIALLVLPIVFLVFFILFGTFYITGGQNGNIRNMEENDLLLRQTFIIPNEQKEQNKENDSSEYRKAEELTGERPLMNDDEAFPETTKDEAEELSANKEEEDSQENAAANPRDSGNDMVGAATELLRQGPPIIIESPFPDDEALVEAPAQSTNETDTPILLAPSPDLIDSSMPSKKHSQLASSMSAPKYIGEIETSRPVTKKKARIAGIVLETLLSGKNSSALPSPSRVTANPSGISAPKLQPLEVIEAVDKSIVGESANVGEDPDEEESDSMKFR